MFQSFLASGSSSFSFNNTSLQFQVDMDPMRKNIMIRLR